jgi:hypothetical protein
MLIGNASVTAPVVDMSGTPGYSLSGNAKFGKGTKLLGGQAAVPDPFAYLQQPNPALLPLQSSKGLSISGNTVTTLDAGLYKGGISISGNANVTLRSGIYYMQGGGFSITGNANVTGNGIMIYNDNGGGSIRIAGNGSVTITPPVSGTYQGISIFQDRTAIPTINVLGNGFMKLSGTIYAASAGVVVTGNGDSLGTQIVSYDLYVTGNGTVNVIYNANSSGKTRMVGLVE